MADTFTRDLFAWLNRINDDVETAAAEFRVAYVIGQHLNRKTRTAWPTLQTLANILQTNERVIRRAVAALVARGHLAVTVQRGRHKPNIYRPIIKGEDNRTLESGFRSGKPDTGVRFSNAENRTSEDRKPDIFDRKTGLRSPTEPSDEPSDEPSEGAAPPQKRVTRSRRRRPSTPWPNGFRLDDDLAEHAVQKASWDRGRALTEFERFENYHRSKGSVFADWRAAWRTWVSNGIKYDRERRGPVIDQHGNTVAAPPPPHRQPWRRRSNTALAMEGRDE